MDPKGDVGKGASKTWADLWGHTAQPRQAGVDAAWGRTGCGCGRVEGVEEAPGVLGRQMSTRYSSLGWVMWRDNNRYPGS